jgi:hypothetical protein
MTKPLTLLLAGAALAACLPVPALAEERKADEVVRKLEDPMTQYMVAGALAAVTKQLLEMRVEPFVRAMREAGAGAAVPDVPPDATLGELAGPRAEVMPQEIMERVPRLMGSLAGIADAFGDMLPELEATARRMKDAIPRE